MKENLHDLANDYVQKVEEDYLTDLSHKQMSWGVDDVQKKKLVEAQSEELCRLYYDDEDHEEKWIHDMRFNRWMNGGDPDGKI